MNERVASLKRILRKTKKFHETLNSTEIPPNIHRELPEFLEALIEHFDFEIQLTEKAIRVDQSERE